MIKSLNDFPRLNFIAKNEAIMGDRSTHHDDFAHNILFYLGIQFFHKCKPLHV
jgi:hypothetical protein